MGGGGDTINYPAQPSYGEGMAEALKAQVELLTGTGDFARTGSLESLLPLEESIRKRTAQTDTDILRQTALGGESQTADDQGRIIIDYKVPPSAAYKIESEDDAFEAYVNIHEDLLNQYEEKVRIEGLPNGEEATKANYGKFHYERYGKAEPFRRLPEVGKAYDVEGNFLGANEDVGSREPIPVYSAPGTYEPGEVVRGEGMLSLLGDQRDILATQADVDAGIASQVGERRKAGYDAEGNFLGMSAFGEDIQRGNLSRQREADLQDVSRLSPLFTEIMEDYKPGTQEALGDARTILAEQADALTGAGAITVPSESTYGGDLGRQTLEAATSYDPSASVTGGTYTGELGAGDDALRGALLADAKQALGQGLTDREQRQIAEAARARSTMMGRTFDQSGAIAEAEARVAEDNQRRMQNRAFAQQALGQEAGLQEADLGRGMQAQLTNQQATNQALQAGMAAGLGREQAQAQLAQAANLAEQGQAQQAAQFGVGATMDAQRANEQLKQQGILGYIQAAGGLAALEDRTTLDPFQAVLGRGGGNALQQGQSVFGQAGYGLNSGPQYLNPEAGLGFIQNQATNAANMYSAQVAADATRQAGLMSGIGGALGGLTGGLLGGSGAQKKIFG